MAADITLVKGARDAASKFQKIELFSEEQLRTMQQATIARKAAKKLEDAAISALVSDITVNESLTPPQQIDAQYAAAGNIRNQVAQLAAQRAKLPVNSPEAFALDQQISTLKQSFTNIANNAKDFKELQKEFVDGSWNMSGGVDPNKRKILNEIFVAEQYTVEFDERGNATYITKLGNMSQKDLSNYYLKDDEMALQIVDYSDEVLSLGNQGTLMKKGDNRYNMLKTKIRNDLRKGGESRINSLIYDDLVDGFDLGLTDLGNKEANENAAVDAIMARLMDVNAQGYSEYKSKPGNKVTDPKDNRTQSEIQRSNSVKASRKEIEGITIGTRVRDKKVPFTVESEDGTRTQREGFSMKFEPRSIQAIQRDYNNIIGDEEYKIVEIGGKYYLENQDPSLSEDERKDFRLDIDLEMSELQKGNPELLNQKIMTNVYKEKSKDRLGTSDDEKLD